MQVLEIISFEHGKSQNIPLLLQPVSAGKPIPADSEIDKYIDLNEFLVEHPAGTFFAKVNGDSLKSIGISDGDILVVDTIRAPMNNNLVIVTINDELTVRVYKEIDDEIILQTHLDQFIPLKIGDSFEYMIEGVITKSIHSY